MTSLTRMVVTGRNRLANLSRHCFQVNTLRNTPSVQILRNSSPSTKCSQDLVSHPRFMCSSPSDVWKLGRLNHVAIATPDLSAASTFYRDVLRAKSVSPPEDLPEHGVTTVFVELDNTKIELLHPLGSSSPIAGFLKKNAAGGIHHVCIEVDDIEEAVKQLKAKNVRCLSESPRIGAHGKPVMFLHPKDCGGVLTELEQA